MAAVICVDRMRFAGSFLSVEAVCMLTAPCCVCWAVRTGVLCVCVGVYTFTHITLLLVAVDYDVHSQFTLLPTLVRSKDDESMLRITSVSLLSHTRCVC